MLKHINKIGLISSTLALVMLSGSAVFALPVQASTYAPSSTPSSVPAASGRGQSFGSAPGAQANSKGRAGLAAGQLKACQNREVAVKNIMT